MNTTIDKRIYNDSVISKAVYWLSADYIISRQSLDEFQEVISAVAKSGNSDAEMVWNERLMQLLNDFKLRQIVADETRSIKTILYAKAFADDDTLNEEDIYD